MKNKAKRHFGDRMVGEAFTMWKSKVIFYKLYRGREGRKGERERETDRQIDRQRKREREGGDSGREGEKRERLK